MNTFLSLSIILFLKSSFVLAVAWAILRLCRSFSAAHQSTLWCVVFTLLAVIPLTALLAPSWDFRLPASSSFTGAGWEVPLSHATEVQVPNARTAPAFVGHAIAVLNATVSVWLAGVLLLVSYRALGSWLLFRFYRTSSRIDNEEIDAMVESIRRSLGIRQAVEIRLSRFCHIPMTWGTFRPVVMLPVQALDWSPEWQQSALSHELGHVQNCDYLKRLLAFLICAFYWPNPLVWAAANQWQLTQEEASDNLVLQNGSTPEDYVAQLMELLNYAPAGHRIAPTVAMARRSTIGKRLTSLLDETRNRKSSALRVVWVGMTLAILLGLPLGALHVSASDSPQTDARKIAAKLNNISMDVSFSTMPLSIVIDHLNSESKALDPTHEGVFIQLSPSALGKSGGQPISMNLSSVSLNMILSILTQQIPGLVLRIKDSGVVLETREENAEYFRTVSPSR